MLALVTDYRLDSGHQSFRDGGIEIVQPRLELYGDGLLNEGPTFQNPRVPRETTERYH